jgi:hypothetical protein
MPIPQFRPPQIVSVKWEDFGNGKNRKLTTHGKS